MLPAAGVVRPLNILLADDNRSNQILLCRILEDAGHSIYTAERGDRAFDLMAAGGVDIAILDLNMPDMSGPDVVKLYRASCIGGEKMSIIILSADATPAAKQESIEAGADEFLTKPVTSAVLLAAIERLTAGAATRATPLPSAAPAQKSASISPLVGSPSAPVLVDQERIQSLRRIARGQRKFLDEYVTAAFDELEKAITDLRTAAMAGDTRTARDALHVIHGTGASIGAIALVANAKAMYNYLSNHRDPDLPGALAEISTSFALTKSTVLANLHQTRDEAFHKGSQRR